MLINKHDHDMERGLFNQEIKVLKAIVRKMMQQKDNFIGEIKELKQILKVPRRHFKYIEGENKFEELVKRKNEYFKNYNLSENQSQLTYDTRSTR